MPLWLYWIVLGLVAGTLAKFLVPGRDPSGCIITILLGIVGAFIGGWLFTALNVSSPMGGLPGTILVAFIGAIVLIFIIRLIRGGSRRAP